jgi:hypothetical protein
VRRSLWVRQSYIGSQESSHQPNEWKADSGGDSPWFKGASRNWSSLQDEYPAEKVVNASHGIGEKLRMTVPPL